MRELPGVNEIHNRRAVNNRINIIVRFANKSKDEVNFIAILSNAKTLEDVERQEEPKEMVIEPSNYIEMEEVER